MSIEETDTTPTPEADKPPETAPTATEAETGPRGLDAFSAWMKTADIKPEDHDSVLADLTPAVLEGAGPTSRIAAALYHRAETEKAAAVAEVNAKMEAAEKAIAEREAKVKAFERDVRQREAAALAIAAAAKDPGAKPEVDPFSPEGAEALAKHLAEKAVFEAQAPARERARAIAIQDAWEKILDAHPRLNDDKHYEAFNAFLAERNKDGKKLDAATAATLYFNDIDLAAMRTKEAADRAAADRARAKAAKNISHSSGSGAPDFWGIYKARRAKDPDEADDWLEQNPEALKAVKTHLGINA